MVDPKDYGPDCPHCRMAMLKALAREENARRRARGSFFYTTLGPAPFHWYFLQAEAALEANLLLPGTTGLLCAIGASIRKTVKHLDPDAPETDPGAAVSMALLSQAHAHDLPVTLLAFPGEQDFAAKFAAGSDPVAIVRLNRDLTRGSGQYFGSGGRSRLSPETLKPVAARLLQISYHWVRGLAAFRYEHGLQMQPDRQDEIPRNPLERYL